MWNLKDKEIKQAHTENRLVVFRGGVVGNKKYSFCDSSVLYFIKYKILNIQHIITKIPLGKQVTSIRICFLIFIFFCKYLFFFFLSTMKM